MSGDELIAAGQQEMVERFDKLVEDVLRATPRFGDASAAELAETAHALNVMNVNYLLDAFGREPRVSVSVAAATLSGIWAAVIA